jgi:protein involved in polysaccharide export with SLBB domain
MVLLNAVMGISIHGLKRCWAAALVLTAMSAASLLRAADPTPTDLTELLRRQPTNDAGATSQSDSVPPTSYTLRPGDIVELQVVQDPLLSLPRVTVQPDGSVQHAYLGRVVVGGKTVEEAQEMMRKLLARDYLVDPRVVVSVLDYAKFDFTIGGKVFRPGTYQWPANKMMTVQEAIVLGGGPLNIGSLSKVTISRIVNGQKEVIKLDVNQLIRDKNAQRFYIRDKDYVEVGEKIF